MKLLILLLFISTQCISQTISSKQAGKLSKEIVDCIKKNSLFIDSLDIDKAETDLKAHIDTFDTYKEVGYYYMRALRKAGDNHSFFLQQSDMDKYSKKQKDNINFTYQLLDGNIGYLDIPGFLSNDQSVINGFAGQIRDAIVSLDSNNIRGWIIDLRNNEGGNMWPMVAGLYPLIGNEVPGYFVKYNKEPEPWKPNTKESGVMISQTHSLKNPTAKIAVLYGTRTMSSGEATAICFIGKSNTRSFGEPTGGFTTANDVFKLSDGNIFVLATSCEMDRNKKMYRGSLVPDVLIENATGDEVLLKAKGWVRE